MSWWKKVLGGSATPPASPPLDPTRQSVYGAQVPFYYGAGVAFADGGPDPIDGVAIFWNETGPHFHYVSSGLVPLCGAELSFRLLARPTDLGTEPGKFLGAIAYQAPKWPISMLNMLARRVHRSQRRFAHGHWWEGPPGVLRPHTELHHLAFAHDPHLHRPGLPVLQAFGVTAAEVESMKSDERERRGDATVDQLARARPLLVTAA